MKKSEKEINKLIELFEVGLNWHCQCVLCAMDRALTECYIDALRWSVGKPTKRFKEVLRKLNRVAAKRIKQESCHAE